MLDQVRQELKDIKSAAVERKAHQSAAKESPSPYMSAVKSVDHSDKKPAVSHARMVEMNNKVESLRASRDKQSAEKERERGEKPRMQERLHRRMTVKDFEGNQHAKVRQQGSPVSTGKQSLFRSLVEEQEAKQSVMTMNDNCLSALIFADPDNIDDPTAGRYDRMIERLALKNQYLATLNNLLSSKKSFVRFVTQLTDSNCLQLFDTLKMLYVEIIELLKGAQQIRHIFEAAPMIATSMKIEEAMMAIVGYICSSLKCERATVFALDKANKELWSKIASGSLD